MTESTTPRPDLTAAIDTAAKNFESVVLAVPAQRLGDATPCTDYDVRGLLNHLLYWMPRLAAAARKQSPPSDDGGEWATDLVGRADGSWQRRLADAGADLAVALRAPDAWEGTASMGGGELPARMYGEMTLCELVFHGWDLAVATETRFTCPEEVAEAAELVMTSMAPMGRRYGVFGAEVEPAPGASTLARALALSGRDPAWRK